MYILPSFVGVLDLMSACTAQETQARPTQAEGGVDASSRNASLPETEHFVDRSTGLPDIATKTLRSQRRTEATERRKETQWQETKRRKGRNKATGQLPVCR